VASSLPYAKAVHPKWEQAKEAQREDGDLYGKGSGGEKSEENSDQLPSVAGQVWVG
jgi:hypothetical protein